MKVDWNLKIGSFSKLSRSEGSFQQKLEGVCEGANLDLKNNQVEI